MQMQSSFIVLEDNGVRAPPMEMAGYLCTERQEACGWWQPGNVILFLCYAICEVLIKK
jgi:hypothetical protein